MKINWKLLFIFLMALVISRTANAQELAASKVIDKIISESTWPVLTSLLVIILVLVIFTWNLIKYGPVIKQLTESTKLYTIFKTSEKNEEFGLRVEGIYEDFKTISSNIQDNLDNVLKQAEDYEKFRGLTTDLQNSTDQLMERLSVLEGTLSQVIEASGQVSDKIDKDPATRIRKVWNNLTSDIDDFISRIPDASFQSYIRSRDRRNRPDFFKLFFDHGIFSLEDKNQLQTFIELHNSTRGRYARDQLTTENANDAEKTQVYLASKLEDFDVTELKLPDSSPVKDEHDASI